MRVGMSSATGDYAPISSFLLYETFRLSILQDFFDSPHSQWNIALFPFNENFHFCAIIHLYAAAKF